MHKEMKMEALFGRMVLVKTFLNAHIGTKASLKAMTAKEVAHQNAGKTVLPFLGPLQMVGNVMIFRAMKTCVLYVNTMSQREIAMGLAEIQAVTMGNFIIFQIPPNLI